MAEVQDLENMLQVIFIEGTEEYVPPSPPKKIPLSERRLEFITTQRGSRMLVVDDQYLYRKVNMSNKGVISWKCWRQGPPTNCSARARISNGHLIEFTKHNGHEPDECEVIKRKMMTKTPQEHLSSELEQTTNEFLPPESIQTYMSQEITATGASDDDQSDLQETSPTSSITSEPDVLASEAVECITID